MSVPEAFGRPGIEPRWTHGSKDGVGTAYSASSRIWFTIWRGVLTEIYYPTVDRPQVRDLQFLVTDGEHFFHEEKRHLRSTVQRLSDHALGYLITIAAGLCCLWAVGLSPGDLTRAKIAIQRQPSA